LAGEQGNGLILGKPPLDFDFYRPEFHEHLSADWKLHLTRSA
jgi:hypothetical protein